MKPHLPAYYTSTYGIPFSVVVGLLKHSQTHEDVTSLIYRAWSLESEGRVAAIRREEDQCKP